MLSSTCQNQSVQYLQTELVSKVDPNMLVAKTQRGANNTTEQFAERNVKCRHPLFEVHVVLSIDCHRIRHSIEGFKAV